MQINISVVLAPSPILHPPLHVPMCSDVTLLSCTPLCFQFHPRAARAAARATPPPPVVHSSSRPSSSVRRPRRPNPTPHTPVTRGKSARAGCRARDAICPRGPRPARGATPRPFLRVPAARRGAPRRHRRPPAARGRLHLTSGVRMRPRYLLVRRRLAGRLAFAAWPDLVRFRSVELAPRPTDGWGLGLIAHA